MLAQTPSASVTRPADTTAYAAGDVLTSTVPAALTFQAAALNGGTGRVVGSWLLDSANQATKPTLELWLFTAAPVMDSDNAVFTPTDVELANLVGVLTFGTAIEGDATVGTGGNSIQQTAVVDIPFKCAAASQKLYGVLVVRNAYTPVSAEVFTVKLRLLQD